jgi:hypothetical protein
MGPSGRFKFKLIDVAICWIQKGIRLLKHNTSSRQWVVLMRRRHRDIYTHKYFRPRGNLNINEKLMIMVEKAIDERRNIAQM